MIYLELLHYLHLLEQRGIDLYVPQLHQYLHDVFAQAVQCRTTRADADAAGALNGA